jgi:hypothetical protein
MAEIVSQVSRGVAISVSDSTIERMKRDDADALFYLIKAKIESAGFGWRIERDEARMEYRIVPIAKRSLA